MSLMTAMGRVAIANSENVHTARRTVRSQQASDLNLWMDSATAAV